MKKTLFIIFALLICTAVFAEGAGRPIYGIVVCNSDGEVVGRYEGETIDKYTVCVQDSYGIPKKGLHVEMFSAENGQGIVYLTASGVVNVREKPTTDSKVVTKIKREEGCMPDTYECLGFEDGWFKIKVDDKHTGYVRMDLADWDSMCTF